MPFGFDLAMPKAMLLHRDTTSVTLTRSVWALDFPFLGLSKKCARIMGFHRANFMQTLIPLSYLWVYYSNSLAFLFVYVICFGLSTLKELVMCTTS